MSSHHIVRDNQEPALLVLNTSETSFDIIQELLEWSPSIIVLESEVDLFLLRGIKIDAVLFEEIHRLEIIEKINDQLPVHLLDYSVNAVDRAIAFLQEKNHTFVNIISNNLDLLTLLSSIEIPKNISVFHNNMRWSLIRSGHFEKWVPAESSLTLFDHGQLSQLYPDKENLIRIDKPKNFWIGESLTS